MKWTFIIQQKIKVILLLSSMVALIGITNYLEHRNIDQIDKSFNSIYYDRLVPATELLHMTQNLYKRRILIESALLDRELDLMVLNKNLGSIAKNTEDRIVNFEKTFLVQQESYALVTFKRGRHDYEKIEKEIIQMIAAGRGKEAREIYTKQLRPKFTQTLSKLEDLSGIQASVGKDIFEQSRMTISNSGILLTLQIVTAVVIGLMIHALIIASRMANVDGGKFHLN